MNVRTNIFQIENNCIINTVTNNIQTATVGIVSTIQFIYTKAGRPKSKSNFRRNCTRFLPESQDSADVHYSLDKEKK